MVIGIHHVQISIDSQRLEESRRFYVELLGMTPIDDPFHGSGFWVAAGEQQVHVRVEDGIDRAKTKSHPAFLVENVAELHNTLSAGNFTIDPQPKMAGFDRFHVIDPSGNRIELMQRV
ncbi:MAG TPA: VOC family protein [Tepidisphaeraceae bacterium]|jgi:catechol 2,3-dioxygenase-like lactoylglutathione lyase family enzyme